MRVRSPVTNEVSWTLPDGGVSVYMSQQCLFVNCTVKQSYVRIQLPLSLYPLQVISYGGTPGGDEKGEPLDYFAYYDEGVVVPDRRGKGRGEAVGPTESTKKGTGGGVGDGEKEAENKNADLASGMWGCRCVVLCNPNRHLPVSKRHLYLHEPFATLAFLLQKGCKEHGC